MLEKKSFPPGLIEDTLSSLGKAVTEREILDVVNAADVIEKNAVVMVSERFHIAPWQAGSIVGACKDISA